MTTEQKKQINDLLNVEVLNKERAIRKACRDVVYAMAMDRRADGTLPGVALERAWKAIEEIPLTVQS